LAAELPKKNSDETAARMRRSDPSGRSLCRCAAGYPAAKVETCGKFMEIHGKLINNLWENMGRMICNWGALTCFKT